MDGLMDGRREMSPGEQTVADKQTRQINRRTGGWIPCVNV
jgi:hypothetical protein